MHKSAETAQAKPNAKVSTWVLHGCKRAWQLPPEKDRMDMLRGHEMWKMLQGEHVHECGAEDVVAVQNICLGELF